MVRRVSGKSIGAFLRDEVTTPLGISDEMFIGAPESVEPRIAKLKSSRMVLTPEREQMRLRQEAVAKTGATPLTARAMAMRPIRRPIERRDEFDSPAGHRAEIPAINGIMSARDLARMYACLAGYGEIDGVRILSERTVRAMSERQTHRPDLVIIVPVGWSLGYMNGGDPGWPQGPRVTSFGHPGAGGAVGFADPEIGLSFGLVLNGLSQDFVGTGRGATLANAARACAENA